MHPTSQPAAGLDMPQPFPNDLCVFIGRFQPFHAAHLQVVQDALQVGRYVLILIGSANAPRSHRNPFTYAERADMIRLSVSEADRERLIILPLDDCLYNDTQWVANAQRQVNVALERVGVAQPRIALIGHSKDHEDVAAYGVNIAR